MRAGIFTDFDGTLAPIVDDPREAAPVRGAVAVLRGLAAKYRVVGVISGRPVHDLEARVRADGVRLVGVHGLEDRDGGRIRVPPEAEMMRGAVERAAGALEGAASTSPGVVVERKGLSVAMHFRRATDPDAAEAELTPVFRAVAATENLVVLLGRRVLEMRPSAGGNKGDALLRLVQEHDLEAVLVAGDDDGDLALFRAAATVPVSCRIGIVSAEAPAGLVETTDVVLPGPAELVALLQRLA